MNALVMDFAEYLSAGNLVSDSTMQSYKRDVMQFLDFYADDPLKVNDMVIASYILRLKSQGRAVSTIARSIASLKAFYRYLYQQKKIEENPMRDIKKPKSEKKLPEILTHDEINRLLDQPFTNEAKGCRDKAMLELLYATGIRVSELTGIDIDKINLRRGLISCSSGGKSRTIPIGKTAVDAVSEYVKKWRNSMIKNKNEMALFLNRNGERISRQGFWKILKEYKEAAGIDKDITPHMLRHSFAAHLLENGADLAAIQEMMGFTNLSSAFVYTQVIENRIVDIYRKTHPRA